VQSIYNNILITEYTVFCSVQVVMELLCLPTSLNNHNDHVDTLHPTFSIECSLCGVSCVIAQIASRAGKNYVPERIRAAGFTDLR
jgi:hypothetical protein